MTKAVFFGDWHENSDYAVEAIRLAKHKHATVAFHVGDFGYSYSDVFLNKVSRALGEMELYVTLGNHENYDNLRKLGYDGTDNVFLRDNIVVLARPTKFFRGRTVFLSLGGAVSVDKQWRLAGSEWWPEESLTFPQCNDAIERGTTGRPIDVMICHDVPAGFDIPHIKNNPFGFPADSIRAANGHRDMLRAVVDEIKPKVLLSGHYHVRQSGMLVGKDYETEVEILNADGGPFWQNMFLMDI